MNVPPVSGSSSTSSSVAHSHGATEGTAAAPPVLLEVEELKVHYPVRRSRKDKVRAVDGVSFQIRAGETVGLIGESGSGKSTISRAIAQLVEPTDGRVFYQGESIYDMPRTQRREMRRQIQMVFQDPHASLDPRMSIWQSVVEPLQIQSLGTPNERKELALRLLERVGLTENHARRYPHELSGGQKQRVSIARALTLDPQLVLCDEPVSALDVALQAEILNLFGELQGELGLAYLFITHDLSVVAHIAHRIGVMYLGQLMELGTVSDVIDRPAHPYTDALLKAQPLPLPSHMRTGERVLLEGEIPSPISPPSGCRFRTRCPHAVSRCSTEVPQWREVSPEHWVACHLAEEINLDGLGTVVADLDVGEPNLTSQQRGVEAHP